MQICKSCGNKIETNGKLCPKCGRPIEIKEQPTVYEKEDYNNRFSIQKKKKNKWIAFFLCLFLGWLGIHKLYEEKFYMTFFYALTFGLFGFGWIFDLISLWHQENPYYVYKTKL